jgi:hypothetical protein
LLQNHRHRREQKTKQNKINKYTNQILGASFLRFVVFPLLPTCAHLAFRVGFVGNCFLDKILRFISKGTKRFYLLAPSVNKCPLRQVFRFETSKKMEEEILQRKYFLAREDSISKD